MLTTKPGLISKSKFAFHLLFIAQHLDGKPSGKCAMTKRCVTRLSDTDDFPFDVVEAIDEIVQIQKAGLGKYFEALSGAFTIISSDTEKAILMQGFLDIIDIDEEPRAPKEKAWIRHFAGLFNLDAKHLLGE